MRCSPSLYLLALNQGKQVIVNDVHLRSGLEGTQNDTEATKQGCKFFQLQGLEKQQGKEAVFLCMSKFSLIYHSCALTRNKGISCCHFQIMFMWYSHIFCNSAPSVSYSLAQEGREQLHWCVPSFSCFFLSERKAQHETSTEWFPFLLQMVSLPTSSEMVSNHHASVCCFFFIKTQYLTCMCSFLNVPMFMCYPSPSVTSISWLQSHSCLHSALSCCNRRIFLVITKQAL